MRGPGRPRKFPDGPARYTLVLSPADKAEVEAFSRWFAYTTNQNIGIGEILLTILRQSPEFQAFRKAAPVVTKPEPSREGVFLEHSLPEPSREGIRQSDTLAEPIIPVTLQAVTTKPEPEPSPVPVVTLQAAPEQAEGPEFKGGPYSEEDPSAALRAALKTLGTSGSEVAKKAKVSAATFTRFMKGGQVPGFTVDRLQAALKETKP